MDSFCPMPAYGIETVSRNLKMNAMHYHDTYELYFLEAGTRNYFVEDKLFSVSAGEFVLIPPGKLHRTGGEFCVRTLVFFSESFLRKTYQDTLVPKLLSCFAHVKILPTSQQQDICREILKRLASCQDETEFAIALGMLLKTLEQCANEELPHDFVGSVVAYINENYAVIDNIAQIAEQFYVSKYHLCRVFKNAMQVTLIEYLNQIRLKNARQLLALSEQEIGKIAELCGYHSVAYFSNLFRKEVHHTPSDYRRLIRERTKQQDIDIID